MFKKLIANLPFTPSLIEEVAFYYKRLRKEEAVRRTGFILLALSLILQVFAALSPPQPTLASSSNDIIKGGFTSKQEAINYCRNNTQDFAYILSYYGVSCNRLRKARKISLKSTSFDKRLDSLGRVPQGKKIARTGKPTDEYGVKIKGERYHMRNLWAWDSRSHSTYDALQVKNKHGQKVMLLFSCGNIVTVGKYSPPEPPKPEPEPDPEPEEPEDVCPNIPGDQFDPSECYPCPEAADNDAVVACLELSKSARNLTQDFDDANGSLAVGGDQIKYTLTAKNKGSQAVKDFVMDEDLNDVLEYADIVDLDGGVLDGDNNAVWPEADIEPGDTLQKSITVQIKDPVPQTPVSTSDPSSYDLVMTNVFYGSSVRIELPESVVKETEQIVQTLPETGPGSSVLVAFVITTTAAYFYSRSRMLAKEINIVRKEYGASGGV